MKKGKEKVGLFFITAIVSFFFFQEGGRSEFKKSNHYDGERFLNPETKDANGIWQNMRLMFALLTSPSWKTQTPKDVKFELPPQPTANDAVEVTFVNHATFVLQSRYGVVLTDPVWAQRASPFTWAGPKRYVEPGIALNDLKRVDVVVLSHNHYDHMDFETLSYLYKTFDPSFIVPLGDKKHLKGLGITKVQELDWWDDVEVKPGIKVTMTPAQHFSARSLFDRNKSLWGSYFIAFGAQKIFFGGDTGYASHFKEIHSRLGAPDLALLPIGAYEPYWFMKPIHMNPDDAVLAHIDLAPKKSLAMHFGTFNLATDKFEQPVEDLKKSLGERGVNEADFAVPVEGSSLCVGSCQQ